MGALLTNASQIYAFVYFGAIIVVALLESIRPRRMASGLLGLRWFGNFTLTILGAMLIRVLFPLFGVGWALFCSERGLGLFNQVAWPAWAEFMLTIVIIDWVNWAQHYLLHRIPPLWRIHRTHHSDPEYDFTTGVRFHPFETVLSTAVLAAAILAIGGPPVAVFVSQLLTVAVAFAEHANFYVPASIDRVLRLVVVTPDMHRIHHSQDAREGNSNFSNVFSWWDRLFGTYVDQPAEGHDGIVFGVAELSGRRHIMVPWMLLQPFLRPELRAEPAAAEAATTAIPRATSDPPLNAAETPPV